MITIDQLLESVDLDFEPRFVTKDLDGEVNIWEVKPVYRGNDYYGLDDDNYGEIASFGKIKLAEFENKPWQECIYEVPRNEEPKDKIKIGTLYIDKDVTFGDGDDDDVGFAPEDYEVPRKTSGKIEKLLEQKLTIGKTKYEYPTHAMLVDKINELVEYVNALIESDNIHEKQIDKLQMKLEPEKCAVNELKGAKNE